LTATESRVMHMCALAGRSFAGAGYQLFAVLQNPQTADDFNKRSCWCCMPGRF